MERLIEQKSELENLITLRHTVNERFGPRQSGVDRLRDAAEMFRDALEGLDRLAAAEDPEQELKVVAEILVQKDDEWAREEGNSDYRLVFFEDIFAKQVARRVEPQEALQMLRDNRSNDAFFVEAARDLAIFTELFRRTHEMIVGMADRDSRFLTDSSRRAVAFARRTRRQIVALDQQIAALESQVNK